MKNYQSRNHKILQNSSESRAVSSTQLVAIFKKWGFAVDTETSYVLIMRNKNFPFQRVAIPKNQVICPELLQLYADDFRIPLTDFYKWLT